LDVVFVATDFGAYAAGVEEGAALRIHADIAVAVVIEFFFAEGVFVRGNEWAVVRFCDWCLFTLRLQRRSFVLVEGWSAWLSHYAAWTIT